MEKDLVKKNKKKISKKKRNNAMLYPIYKMFSWDLLSFYSVEFLFYTITKGISASQVLMLTSIYIMCKILFQIPAVAISDYLGKRKSMILGNSSLIVYMLVLIFARNFEWIAIANIFCAFGYDLKTISEGNLLYDSVSTKGGDGIYTKIDSRGASAYYILDTVLAVMAGYFFVINNYIPIYISLFFIIVSTILSIKFKEIYKSKENQGKESFSKFLKGYSSDILNSFRFIKRSKRMKSYLIFAAVFYGLIKIMSTYKSDLLIDIGVTEEQFSMIYAVLALIAAISVTFSKKVQKQFRNKTLTFLSLSYIISIIVIGAITLIFTDNIALPIVLIFYTLTRICDSQWYVTQYTYLKNFTTVTSRNKISFTFELVTGIVASMMSLIGAVILDYTNIRYAVILIGLSSLAIMVVILDYMRSRFGLRPSQYTKEDIEFVESKEEEDVQT